MLTSYMESILNVEDNEGNTPLHLAGKFANYRTLMYLVKYARIDPWIKKGEGCTFSYIVES